jgi:hypothetical protein
MIMRRVKYKVGPPPEADDPHRLGQGSLHFIPERIREPRLTHQKLQNKKDRP